MFAKFGTGEMVLWRRRENVEDVIEVIEREDIELRRRWRMVFDDFKRRDGMVGGIRERIVWW